jgi:PPOX class probable F420-dependent enzyme
MAASLAQDVVDRLKSDHYGWFTTVAKSGQPVPRLVWFYFDGSTLSVYTMPSAAKVAHVTRHPQVSLHLDSDGKGGGIVIIGGQATVDATEVDCREDQPYWAKYGPSADEFGLTDSMGSYSTRLRISIDKVWGTPTEG